MIGQLHVRRDGAAHGDEQRIGVAQYDVNNRLTAVTGPDGNETSVYAPDGTRVRVNGSASNGDSPVLSDLQGNPVDDFSQYRIHRVYGPGVDEVLAEVGNLNAGQPGWTYRYLHHDGLGSVTAATTTDGTLAWSRTYRAFGAMTTTPPTGDAQYSRMGYTGREISAGSLMEYRSRYYDTGYGRFTQQDASEKYHKKPSRFQGYHYVSNAPPVRVDPTGNEDESYPVTFPKTAFNEWNVNYFSQTFSFGGGPLPLLSFALGWVFWSAEANDPVTAPSVDGIIVWTGLSVGKLPVSVIISSMNGYSSKQLSGNSVFDGDVFYIGFTAALVAGWGYSFYGIGALYNFKAGVKDPAISGLSPIPRSAEGPAPGWILVHLLDLAGARDGHSIVDWACW